MRIAQIMAGQEAGGAELFYARLTSALAQDTDLNQIAILRCEKEARQAIVA